MVEKKQESIGARLVRLRKGLHLTQEKLADLADIPRRTLQDIEYGATADPGVKTIQRLAEKLNVSSEYLINGGVKHDARPNLRTVGEMTPDELAGFLRELNSPDAPNHEPLSSDEIAILDLVRKTGSPNRRLIVDFIKTLLAQDSQARPRRSRVR